MTPRCVAALGFFVVACQGTDVARPAEVGTLHQALGAPLRLRDIFTIAQPPTTQPTAFTPLGGQTLFFATTPTEGMELWVSDGTAQGTHLVRDINLGPSGSEGSAVSPLLPLGTSAFFPATSGQVQGLWKSDGTFAGTQQVTPTKIDVGPITFGSQLLFVGEPSLGYHSIFTSDGTSPGTGARSALLPCIPTQLVAAGANVFFDCNDFNQTYGNEPWVTDGTDAGTHVLRDIVAGTTGSSPTLFSAIGGEAYFFVRVGTNAQLWKSDGTNAGTVLVEDLGANVTADARVVSGGLLYFETKVGFGAPTLSVFDSTDGGTTPLTATNENLQQAAPQTPNLVVFTAGATAQPWASNGTAAGTFPLGTLNTGIILGNYTELFGDVWFQMNDEVWRTDGTVLGTTQVSTQTFIQITGFGPGAGGLVYFGGTTGANGNEPWVSDGTNVGTRQLAALIPAQSPSGPDHFFTVRDHVLFTAGGNGGVNPVFWRTDGTVTGTQALAAPSGLTFGFAVPSFAVAQDKLYFVGFTTATGTDFFRTDGSDAGIEALDLVPGSGGILSWNASGTDLGYYASVQAGATYEVAAWTSPDAGATVLGTFSAMPTGPFVSVGSTVYFPASTAAGGLRIWRTNGTPIGTVQATHLSNAASISGLTAFDGRLYFTVNGQIYRLECDDSAVPLSPLAYSPQMAVAGGSLYFSGYTASTGVELWKTDGTTTSMVADIATGPLSSLPGAFLEWNGRLVFFADDGSGNNFRLFVTDGSAAGTHLATTVPVLAPVSVPLQNVFPVPGGELYVAGWSVDAGIELWQISDDGGQVMVADIDPGVRGSDPQKFAVVDSTLVFSADDGTGNEPWAVAIDRGAADAGSGGQSACVYAIPDAGTGGGDAGVGDAGVGDAGANDAGSGDAGSAGDSGTGGGASDSGTGGGASDSGTGGGASDSGTGGGSAGGGSAGGGSAGGGSAGGGSAGGGSAGGGSAGGGSAGGGSAGGSAAGGGSAGGSAAGGSAAGGSAAGGSAAGGSAAGGSAAGGSAAGGSASGGGSVAPSGCGCGSAPGWPLLLLLPLGRRRIRRSA